MTIDPKLFLPDAVDPETAAFNTELERMLSAMPPFITFPPSVIREMREAGQGFFGPIIREDWARDITIPGPAGKIPLRLFVPDVVEGVYLHIHGGGFVLGHAHHQDPLLAMIAKKCEVAVVSVEYRLAPEDPYPAGPDDCEAAAVWLVANAKREFGADRLVIGGESAGANLAAVTLLRMRDRHGFTGFAGANLTFGVFDLSMTPSARRFGDRNLIINTPIMRWFNDHYIPSADPRDPDISPVYADLHDMPPALFTIGTLDPLLDDSLFMHARWLAAGNEAGLDVYPGGVHGFIAFPLEIGRRAHARMLDFIARAVSNPHSQDI
jgi:acetyl esterase/lipase